MEVKQLVAAQVEFDRAHGFPVEFEGATEKYAQVSKDLIGLLGEIGEFSNLVKKITLHLERPTKYNLSMVATESHLREELIDALIYLVRLAAILRVDIEDEYMRKMSANASRYEALR